MSQWWTYRPEDMLLFSPRVYWRMFELQNASVWPFQLVTFGAGLLMLGLATKRANGNERWIASTLAILWVFVGWTFLWHRYATINWAISYVAPLFLLQSVLLLIAGFVPRALVFEGRGLTSWSGMALASTGLFLYPVLLPAFGSEWEQAQIFGIAPDPTAIGTVGLLLMARGKLRWSLFPVPVLWCLVSGLTLWTMGDATAWLPIAAVASALATCAWATVRKS